MDTEWEFVSEDGLIGEANRNSEIDCKGPPNLQVIHVPFELDLPESFQYSPPKGTEFADMKPESPNRGLVPQIDQGDGKTKKEKKTPVNSFDWNEPDNKECQVDGGFSFWKMGMTGIGALCSFGFACATIFVIALNNNNNNNHNHKVVVYSSDDKRMKEVVQHTTKMKDAISALKGIQLGRPHIPIAGYFDAINT